MKHLLFNLNVIILDDLDYLDLNDAYRNNVRIGTCCHNFVNSPRTFTFKTIRWHKSTTYIKMSLSSSSLTDHLLVSVLPWTQQDPKVEIYWKIRLSFIRQTIILLSRYSKLRKTPLWKFGENQYLSSKLSSQDGVQTVSCLSNWKILPLMKNKIIAQSKLLLIRQASRLRKW